VEEQDQHQEVGVKKWHVVVEQDQAVAQEQMLRDLHMVVMLM